jgi:iron complex outermembrane receptor protein
VSKRLDLQLGLRGEGLTTDATAAGGDDSRLHHRSSVWTPMFHAVWRLDDAKRDQLRLALTRSYRPPPLNSLIAQRSINGDYPTGANTPTNADRAGNPELRPEIARGLEFGIERYLEGGGLLSANLFHRQIKDLMRNVTALETVDWSPVPRWVSRPQNLGDATTTGLELEARSRLDRIVGDAPPIDLRGNLSLFRSRVASVPGPNNRIDEQPDATANFGADWRLDALPLTVGATLNWTPGYASRIADEQFSRQDRRRVFDAYALWRVRPGLQVRVSVSNLLPLDDATAGTSYDETARTVVRTTTNWQLQLEMKL